MKSFFTLFFLTISLTFFAQQIDYNTKNGAIANGYDVVAYFNKKAKKGNKKFRVIHNHIQFLFSSKKNVNTFKKNPDKYIPQYGGYCAYAMGINSERVKINPKSFEIRDGKLYLFYNSWGTNTLDLWLKEQPNKLQKQADKNWEKIKYLN